jgi:catechol 2,3-dioxygenase
MAIPAPNLNPPFNIVRLSHTELRVTDLAWSRGFYVDTLGLQVTHEDSETIYLRAMEERGHHCMILKKAAQPSVGVLGFKVWSEEDLDKAESWFRSRDLPTSWIERPFMGRVLSTRDPFGVPLEFYARMDRLEPIHQKYKLYRGVKPLRIDHFNLFSSNVDESVKFYGDIGFRVTEYTEDAITGPQLGCMDAPQGRRSRHRLYQRHRTAPAPHRFLGADATQHHRSSRSDVDNRISFEYRARPRPARHLERLLPLHPRPGRPPYRDLLFGLPDHRPGSRTDQVGPQGSAAPDPLGRARAAELVRGLGSEFEGADLVESDLKSQPIIAP